MALEHVTLRVNWTWRETLHEIEKSVGPHVLNLWRFASLPVLTVSDCMLNHKHAAMGW